MKAKARYRGVTANSAPVLAYEKTVMPGGGFTVCLPIRTGCGPNERLHWSKRSALTRSERKSALMLTPAHDVPCCVTLTRLSPGELDDDNLRPSLKAVRDGVADRLGIDDRDRRVVWRYRQRRAQGHAVLVTITRTPEDDDDAAQTR